MFPIPFLPFWGVHIDQDAINTTIIIGAIVTIPFTFLAIFMNYGNKGSRTTSTIVIRIRGFITCLDHALTMTKNLNRSRHYSFSSKAMDNFNEQLFEMIGRCRSVSNGRGSRAGPIIGKECQMIVSNNPTRSKTASITGINKAKVIADFISSNGTRC